MYRRPAFAAIYLCVDFGFGHASERKFGHDIFPCREFEDGTIRELVMTPKPIHILGGKIFPRRFRDACHGFHFAGRMGDFRVFAEIC
jgi:hypothetical protein